MNKNYFKPVKDLSDKNNFKRYFYIERDGTSIERVLLETLDEDIRETIIYKQLLTTLNIADKDITLISRDDPWDFYIKHSNGEKLNIEITSIAENEWSFRKKTSEEKLKEVTLKPKIQIGELRKVESKFGSMDNLREFLTSNEALHKTTLVDNPLYNTGPYFLLSDSKDQKLSYVELFQEAIEKKRTKRRDLSNVILILDDRTMRFSIEELEETLDIITNDLAASQFLMVWAYVGFYSDNDGLNAECFFRRVK